MKQLKLFPALTLALLLCLASCTQSETPIPQNVDTPIQYRSQLFDSPCESLPPQLQTHFQTCTNNTDSPSALVFTRCASREDFLAAAGGDIQRAEYFYTFPVENGRMGTSYCSPQIHPDFQDDVVICEEKCVDATFNYWNTGVGDQTLYLMSNTPWKAESLTIYGLDYPYTYTIEGFENHGDPLPDGG